MIYFAFRSYCHEVQHHASKFELNVCLQAGYAKSALLGKPEILHGRDCLGFADSATYSPDLCHIYRI